MSETSPHCQLVKVQAGGKRQSQGADFAEMQIVRLQIYMTFAWVLGCSNSNQGVMPPPRLMKLDVLTVFACSHVGE